MQKHYISASELLADSFALAMQVFESEFRPDFIVGVWRGGTPVAIALHELLSVLGAGADHFAIRTTSYTGMGRRGPEVKVDGLEYLTRRIDEGNSVLLVDDVYDTGLSLERVIEEIERDAAPCEIRIATPWYKPASVQTGRTPHYYIHRTASWLVFPHELEGLEYAEMAAGKPELQPLLERLRRHLVS